MRQSISLTRTVKKKSPGTHPGGTSGHRSDKRKAIENEFCTRGEPEAENYKRERE